MFLWLFLFCVCVLGVFLGGGGVEVGGHVIFLQGLFRLVQGSNT